MPALTKKLVLSQETLRKLTGGLSVWTEDPCDDTMGCSDESFCPGCSERFCPPPGTGV
jgi:hypothetical protein